MFVHLCNKSSVSKQGILPSHTFRRKPLQSTHNLHIWRKKLFKTWHMKYLNKYSWHHHKKSYIKKVLRSRPTFICRLVSCYSLDLDDYTVPADLFMHTVEHTHTHTHTCYTFLAQVLDGCTKQKIMCGGGVWHKKGKRRCNNTAWKMLQRKTVRREERGGRGTMGRRKKNSR